LAISTLETFGKTKALLVCFSDLLYVCAPRKIDWTVEMIVEMVVMALGETC
jgi:hypothetical protein